jgi:hypothetical protein
MIETDFNTVLMDRLNKTGDTLGSKAKEYCRNEDRLYNFKRAAEIMRTTPEKALLGMAMKHLVSVIDLVENPTTISEHLIDEKIGDLICYCVLLEARLLERLKIMSVNLNTIREENI